MALLTLQCRSRVIMSQLLKRASLVSQIPDRNVTVKSKMFPEYSVLYEFNGVKGAARFNRTKYHTTILCGFGSPVMYCGQLLEVIRPDIVDGFLFYSLVLTVFVHAVGFLFNDTVGYIYVKNNDDKMKISVLDYWGERADIDTTKNDIRAFCDLPSRFNNPWYQRVQMMGSTKTYKLYLSAGRVLDNPKFDGIFGRIY